MVRRAAACTHPTADYNSSLLHSPLRRTSAHASYGVITMLPVYCIYKHAQSVALCLTCACCVCRGALCRVVSCRAVLVGWWLGGRPAGELALFERLDPSDPRGGTSAELCVKKARRNYDPDERTPDNFRTFDALGKTMLFLRRVMDAGAHKLVDVHKFLWDR